MMEGKLLSAEEVCDYLCIGRNTIYQWITDKSLPAYRPGRLWKFKKKQVDQWLEK